MHMHRGFYSPILRKRYKTIAKDDYYVIVYKILAYLYTKLKAGEEIEPEMLMYNGTLFQIRKNASKIMPVGMALRISAILLTMVFRV